jgi:hypothetical protein
MASALAGCKGLGWFICCSFNSSELVGGALAVGPVAPTLALGLAQGSLSGTAASHPGHLYGRTAKPRHAPPTHGGGEAEQHRQGPIAHSGQQFLAMRGKHKHHPDLGDKHEPLALATRPAVFRSNPTATAQCPSRSAPLGHFRDQQCCCAMPTGRSAGGFSFLLFEVQADTLCRVASVMDVCARTCSNP